LYENKLHKEIHGKEFDRKEEEKILEDVWKDSSAKTIKATRYFCHYSPPPKMNFTCEGDIAWLRSEWPILVCKQCYDELFKSGQLVSAGKWVEIVHK